MKKVTLGLLCLIGVMSCEIPKSITIKGNPGVYLPLGSPFGESDDFNRLENRISPEKIKETMSAEAGDAHKVKVYDYQGSGVDSDVQAFIVRYPIVEMKLDLEKYINEATKADDDTTLSHTIEADIGDSSQFSALYPQGAYLTGNGPKNAEGTPLFKVSLADMAKLVQEVRGNAFGLEMIYDNDTLAQNVQIRIPAFGINTYIPGTRVGNKLRFVNTTNNQTFIPKPNPKGSLNEKNELEIFVRVTGPCSGTIVPDMVFDWTEATVDASGNDSVKGTYAIKNELRTFLGENAEINKVTGYIYVGDIDTATMGIKAANTYVVNPDTQIYPKPRPSFLDSDSGSFSGPLPLDSLNNQNGINLTPAFNTSSNSLEYEIKVTTMIIHPGDRDKTITADLVILFPLQFNIYTPSSIPEYVKLELGGIFPKPGSGDLFMRTGKDNPDDLLNDLDTVTIKLKQFHNNIIEHLHIVINGNKNWMINFDEAEPSLSIKWKDVPYPFSPKFEILIDKDQGKPYATLKIKRQTSDEPLRFDFFLTVEAKANINHTIDL